MKALYESSPFYRLFNVILVILYTFVVLISIVAGLYTYSSRTVTNASVQCEDGTRWDAIKIYDNSYALCGICTQRNSDGSRYNNCTYKNMTYSSYDIVNKKYNWSWWIIIAPLTVFTFGFGIVDFIKITIIYILSGKIALEKSLLLKLLVAISKD